MEITESRAEFIRKISSDIFWIICFYWIEKGHDVNSRLFVSGSYSVNWPMRKYVILVKLVVSSWIE